MSDLKAIAGSLPPGRSFMGAARIQGRVIVALALRNLTNDIGGSPLGFAFMFLRPAIIVGLTILMYGAAKRTPQGMPVMAFVTTGWLAWFGFIRVFKDQSRGQANPLLLFPQVSTLDLMLADFVLESFVYTNVFGIFVFATLMIERSPFPANPLQVLLAFWCILWFGAIVGIVVNSLARIAPLISIIGILVRRVGALVSGAMVSAADTPPAILAWLSWSPLFHCFELMRKAWWPSYVSPIGDTGYVALWLFFSAALALALERFTRRWVSE